MFQVEWSYLICQPISQILLKQPSDCCWWDKGTRTVKHGQAVAGSLLLAWLALSFMDFPLGSRTVSIGATVAEQAWAEWGDQALGDHTLGSMILLSPAVASPGSVRRGTFELSRSLLSEQGGLFASFLNEFLFISLRANVLWEWLIYLPCEQCTWNGSMCGMLSMHWLGVKWEMTQQRGCNPQISAISVLCTWTWRCADTHIYVCWHTAFLVKVRCTFS